MKIERETKPNDDGTVTVTTVITYEKAERLGLSQVATALKDLAGYSNLGGVDQFDHTAMIAMTEHRKRLLVDAADLIMKGLVGD